ncbi:MAG: amino acid ABC transporter permease [Holosporaceae bacterium]|jgi:polar amino acid transport system permease protein|nr:amino acid ABC transporter permease [Holosporaceae bacterium]
MGGVISNCIYLGKGLVFTLELTMGGIIIGLTLGVLLSVLRYCRICVPLVKGWSSVVRGTPLILQLSIIYFSVPGLVGVKLDMLSAGVIAFGLNSSAYMAEIFRSGIESLPKGQFEAAQTLGISNFYMWRDIILPQVVKNILPALVNEVIALLKETTLISVIGGMDVMRRSQIVAAEQFEYFMPLCIAGAYYYCMAMLIEFVGEKIEQRISYAKNP